MQARRLRWQRGGAWWRDPFAAASVPDGFALGFVGRVGPAKEFEGAVEVRVRIEAGGPRLRDERFRESRQGSLGSADAAVQLSDLVKGRDHGGRQIEPDGRTRLVTVAVGAVFGAGSGKLLARPGGEGPQVRIADFTPFLARSRRRDGKAQRQEVPSIPRLGGGFDEGGACERVGAGRSDPLDQVIRRPVLVIAVTVRIDGIGAPGRARLPQPLLEFAHVDGAGQRDPRRQVPGVGAARDRDRRDGAERRSPVRAVERPEQAVRAPRGASEGGVVPQPAAGATEALAREILGPRVAEVEPAAFPHEGLRGPRERAREAVQARGEGGGERVQAGKSGVWHRAGGHRTSAPAVTAKTILQHRCLTVKICPSFFLLPRRDDRRTPPKSRQLATRTSRFVMPTERRGRAAALDDAAGGRPRECRREARATIPGAHSLAKDAGRACGWIARSLADELRGRSTGSKGRTRRLPDDCPDDAAVPRFHSGGSEGGGGRTVRPAFGQRRGQQRRVESLSGGAERDRTVDLLTASQALSQLSYGPTTTRGPDGKCGRRLAKPGDASRLAPGCQSRGLSGPLRGPIVPAWQNARRSCCRWPWGPPCSPRPAAGEGRRARRGRRAVPPWSPPKS